MEVLSVEQVRAIQSSFNQAYGELSHTQVIRVLDSFDKSWSDEKKAGFFNVHFTTFSRWKRGVSAPAGKNKVLFRIWLDLLKRAQ